MAKPARGFLDDELADLCRRLREADAEERAAARRAISMDEFYTLLTFSRRSAVFALRDRRMEHVRDGLVAIALIEAERVDFRDVLVALSLLYYAATRIGADVSRHFTDAAALSEPEVAKLFKRLRFTIAGAPGSARCMGPRRDQHRQRRGACSLGFRAYDPTYDLAAIALEIAGVFEADEYQPDDPELATDLPAVWLRHASKPDLPDALGAIRAAATVRGRLRPDASPAYASQQLTIFLVEVHDASWAQRLVAMSRRPSDN